jgi:hypothetical protein
MVRYLDEASVRAVLRWDPLIAAMESALAAFSSGQVIQPVRNMLTIEEGKRYLGIMPAVMQEAMGETRQLLSRKRRHWPTHPFWNHPAIAFRYRRASCRYGRTPHHRDARLRSRPRSQSTLRHRKVTFSLCSEVVCKRALIGTLYCGSANLTTYAYGVESRRMLSASPTSMASEQWRAWSQRYEMRT